MSQCCRAWGCCLCTALLVPTRLPAGNWGGSHVEEGEVAISSDMENVGVVSLGWAQPCSYCFFQRLLQSLPACLAPQSHCLTQFCVLPCHTLGSPLHDGSTLGKNLSLEASLQTWETSLSYSKAEPSASSEGESLGLLCKHKSESAEACSGWGLCSLDTKVPARLGRRCLMEAARKCLLPQICHHLQLLSPHCLSRFVLLQFSHCVCRWWSKTFLSVQNTAQEAGDRSPLTAQLLSAGSSSWPANRSAN